MKNFSVSVFLLLTFMFGFSANLRAHVVEEESLSDTNIIQFDLEDLEINKNGLFVNQNGGWVQLKAIIQDNDGGLLRND